jgi:hypothetical protein
MIVTIYEPDPLEAEQKESEGRGQILAIEPIFREGSSKAVSQMFVLETESGSGKTLHSYRLKCSEEGVLTLQKIGARKVPAADRS